MPFLYLFRCMAIAIITALIMIIIMAMKTTTTTAAAAAAATRRLSAIFCFVLYSAATATGKRNYEVEGEVRSERGRRSSA